MAQALSPSGPGLPETTSNWAELAPQLRQLREQLGAPSYSKLAMRVTQLRRERGMSEADAQVGRVTVYDCFRDDRRRVDHTLVLDIVTGLGASQDQRSHWEGLLEAFRQRRAADSNINVSRTLPADSMPFVGRESQIDQIATAGSAFWLSGMPGAGKTRLAVAAAQELLTRGVSSQSIIADLRGHSSAGPPADPDAALNSLLRLLGVPAHQRTGSLSSRSTQLRDLLISTKSTLVLDDAAEPSQVQNILEDLSNIPVIITSRRQFATDPIPEVTELSVEAFTPEESQQLLHQVIGSQRAQEEPAAATALAETSAHLPLAVGLTASWVAARNDWSLNEHLDVITSRQVAGRVNDEVAESFLRSYQRLSEDAQRMMRLMAAYPVTALHHVSVMALSRGFVDQPQAALAELLTHHLLTQPEPHTYSMHSLLRLHAADLSTELDRPAVRQSSRENLYRYLVSHSWAAYEHYMSSLGHSPRQPTTSQQQVTAQEIAESKKNTHHDDGENFFRTTADLLLYATEHAGADSHPEFVHTISQTLGPWLLRTERSEEAEQLHRHALQRAESAGDALESDAARIALAQVLMHYGRFAEIDEVLKRLAAVQTLEPHDFCSLHNTWGQAKEHLGDNTAAREHYLRCIATARTIQDAGMLAEVLNNMAGLHNRVGEHEAARGVLAESVQISKELQDEVGMARGLVNLGAIEVQLDMLAEAEDHLRHGLESFEDLGYVRGQSAALSILSRVLLDQKQYMEGVEVCRQGIEVSRRENLEQFTVTLLRQLSRGLRELNELAAARQTAQEAVSLAEQLDDPTEVGESLDALARCVLLTGDADAARRHWQRALPLLESAEAPTAEVIRQKLEDLNQPETAES